MVDARAIKNIVDTLWDAEKSPLLSALMDFIRTPNLSPAYEPDWAEAGHADAVAELLAEAVETLKKDWAGRGIHSGDIRAEILGGRDNPVFDGQGARRTPALLVEVPAFGGHAGDEAILAYGHMDKQPEMNPWSAGLGPRSPVIKNGKLYGRGGADDGYALFGILSALAALRGQGHAHARVVILIEGCEESGGDDVVWYLRSLEKRLGDVSLVLCLDSGAGDYGRLWLTTSLRGLAGGLLRVETLSGAVHSGAASGIVPSPFRILRLLLSRLENEKTGQIKAGGLRVAIPAGVRAEAAKAAAILGGKIHADFPFCPGVHPVAADGAALLLNRTWRPQLSVVGMTGLPPAATAGNTALPFAEARLSLRLPPILDSAKAAALLKTLLEADPPYQARVSFTVDNVMAGWRAPQAAPWFRKAIRDASLAFFGQPAINYGEGGSIDFMNVLSRLYPQAQMLVTGVLGPGSNAHGPDESLNLGMARKLAMCLAHVVAGHAGRG